jgi:hypothetical protein
MSDTPAETDGTSRREDGVRTMADVDHTHPETNETFGTVYRRGPAMADGSGPAVGDGPGTVPGDDAASSARGVDGDVDTMADVDHAPPFGEGARGVWERGGELPIRAAADGGTADDADAERDHEDADRSARRNGANAGDAVGGPDGVREDEEDT